MQQRVFAEGMADVPNRSNLHLLYKSYARELWSFAQRRVGRDEAADVVHDTYLRVLQYGDKVELENPRAYLYRVTANVATDRGMALKASNECMEPEVDLDMLDSPAPCIETIIAARQRLQCCLAALDELPAVYRHVFLLHRIDGMAQSEIADTLDIPKRTVERYIAKTLEHCLKQLASENS